MLFVKLERRSAEAFNAEHGSLGSEQRGLREISLAGCLQVCTLNFAVTTQKRL